MELDAEPVRVTHTVGTGEPRSVHEPDEFPKEVPFLDHGALPPGPHEEEHIRQ